MYTQCDRRRLLALASAGLLLNASNSLASESATEESWSMGLIADLHYGLAREALSRLDKFMQRVDEVNPDNILQLGDFNFGVDAQDCMQLWSQFPGSKYHVLGNHDMDKATKAEIADLWQMPSPYYSFDHKGWHFVILDRNHLRSSDEQFTDYAKANFYVASEHRGFADPVQLEWLAADLAHTQLPTVVFSHQGLGMESTTRPDTATAPIEAVLARANADSQKVRACFCGHHHIDRYNFKSGIHYVWINSASYYWVGQDYGRMAPYTEPLFTFLTFHSDHSIHIAPSQSAWAKPSPKERGYPDWEHLNTEIVARTLA